MNGGDNTWSSIFNIDYPVAGELARDEIIPIKKAHPEWCIETLDGRLAWNYAVPGVHEYRLRCFRELAESYEGRVVDTAGDSVFGEFDSVVNAVLSATTISPTKLSG